MQSNALDAITTYLDRIGTYGLAAIIFELVLIGTIVYIALNFLQGTRGARLLESLAIIVITSFFIVRLVAETLELDRVIFLYPYFLGGVLLTTLVAFQPEIRRGLIRIGEARWIRSWSTEANKTIEPIVTACARLSQKKIGALLAIQREVGMEAIVETGVKLNAIVSSELLETLFWPGTALHDLGVIVRDDVVVAASCQFPTVESAEVAQSLGSRHRAGLGMSQDSDALIIIVSEETGTISLAISGRLYRPLTPDQLREKLFAGLTSESDDDKPVETNQKASEELSDEKDKSESPEETIVSQAKATVES